MDDSLMMVMSLSFIEMDTLRGLLVQNGTTTGPPGVLLLLDWSISRRDLRFFGFQY